MRIGFISDIHGNLEALRAAFKILELEKVDEVFCLGDIVGYGVNPSESVDLVRKNCSRILLGNHDAAVIGKEDPKRFNRYALIASIWTAEHLKDEDKELLNSLPYTHSFKEQYFLVHGSPFKPEDFNYILTPTDALFEFAEFSQKIGFIGHSHKPAIFTTNSKMMIPVNEIIELHDDYRYIVNVGSVGQPRDGDPRGCLVIYDSWKCTLQYIRFEYPIHIAQRKIESYHLPTFLSERLSRGI